MSTDTLQAYRYLKGILTHKLIACMQRDKSILTAIAKTSVDTNIEYKTLTHLLFSMFDSKSNRQLKKKIKELMPQSNMSSTGAGMEPYFKREFLKKIIMYFKKGYLAKDVADRLEISYVDLKKIIEKARQKRLIPDKNIPALKRLYFNKRVIYKIIEYMRKGLTDRQILRKFRMHPSHLTKYLKRAKLIIDKDVKDNEAKNKIIEIRKLYLELGTLEKVADRFGITRERVRQLLKKGEEYHLFKYEKYSKVKLEGLATKYSRNDLIQAIKSYVWVGKICGQLNIEKSEFEKLLEHYEIDYSEYRLVASMGRYMAKYSQIIDVLGHHPSATEMNQKSEWHATWAGISRLWGSLDAFRKEFGIEKPKMKIHPNTLNALESSIEKRHMIKMEKKGNIYNFLKDSGPTKIVTLCNKFRLQRGTVNNYISELLKEKKILKIEKGSYTKYIVNEKLCALDNAEEQDAVTVHAKVVEVKGGD